MPSIAPDVLKNEEAISVAPWHSPKYAIWGWESNRREDIQTTVVSWAPEIGNGGNGDWSAITNAVERSMAILQLRDDWDGEGAQGYDRDTWQRAADFVLEQSRYARDCFRRSLGVPRISPADDGSIDVMWISDSAKLLVNFPRNSKEGATFYGANPEGGTVSGMLGEKNRPDLVLWLTQLK